MKVGELLRILREDGWYLVHIRGSHRQLKHLVKPGRAPGTLRSVYKQAKLMR